jgi:(2Fe-2S) ferredoxin
VNESRTRTTGKKTAGKKTAGKESAERLFYRCHVFCCVNQREADHPRGSCSRRGSVPLRDHMKARAKEMGLKGVRINQSGCLDRCELGPTVVVYPEGIWYRCTSEGDVDEILESHVRDGVPVARLKLGLRG